jgi:hypothetical protein
MTGQKKIIAAGNTVVPAILELEHLGFAISAPARGEIFTATRGDETYSADDPVTVLGLVRLIELRNWEWGATDSEIESTLDKYGLR